MNDVGPFKIIVRDGWFGRFFGRSLFGWFFSDLVLIGFRIRSPKPYVTFDSSTSAVTFDGFWTFIFEWSEIAASAASGGMLGAKLTIFMRWGALKIDETRMNIALFAIKRITLIIFLNGDAASMTFSGIEIERGALAGRQLRLGDFLRLDDVVKVHFRGCLRESFHPFFAECGDKSRSWDMSDGSHSRAFESKFVLYKDIASISSIEQR